MADFIFVNNATFSNLNKIKLNIVETCLRKLYFKPCSSICHAVK